MPCVSAARRHVPAKVGVGWHALRQVGLPFSRPGRPAAVFSASRVEALAMRAPLRALAAGALPYRHRRRKRCRRPTAPAVAGRWVLPPASLANLVLYDSLDLGADLEAAPGPAA